MNKNMILWGILPIIIIIMFILYMYLKNKVIDYVLRDEYNDEYKGFEEQGMSYHLWSLRKGYNEVKNCGYTGTFKDYIKMVGVKKDDNT